MKNLAGYLLTIVFLAAFLQGCGSIYSPTLNLPHEPLLKNQGQLTGTGSILPQYGTSGSLGIANSAEGQASYAFSDRFSIQGKAWSQVSELYQFSYNGGTSLSGTYMISPKDASLPMGLIATSSILIEGRNIKANGGSLHLAAWLPEIGMFRPYAAVGAGIMVVNFKLNDWGYGGILNLGTSVKFSEAFSANLEVFAVLQRYIYYHALSGILAPSLSFSWRFDNN